MQTMTPAERSATDAFRLHLLEQFASAADRMWTAKSADDNETYDEAVQEVRVLYREIREVEFCLRNNVLPDDIAEASRVA